DYLRQPVGRAPAANKSARTTETRPCAGFFLLKTVSCTITGGTFRPKVLKYPRARRFIYSRFNALLSHAATLNLHMNPRLNAETSTSEAYCSAVQPTADFHK